ncbi:unnamed protein product [Candidula unifasciata]|uniref:Poly [ADP-ribose] polymerase n=1 Tax=Candidula unifasciata TaxID=100452 RepID=A0A8S3YH24_9EUPU|nr:unnamed protein product [Candidula unifasciata]
MNGDSTQDTTNTSGGEDSSTTADSSGITVGDSSSAKENTSGITVGDSSSVKENTSGITVGDSSSVKENTSGITVGDSSSAQENTSGITVGDSSSVKENTSGITVGGSSSTQEDTCRTASGESSSTTDFRQDAPLFVSDIQTLFVSNKSLLSCDLLWSLFVSAARSYRFSSVLHPFPPMYHVNSQDEKNIFALRNTVSKVPHFSTAVEFVSSLSQECKELLSWVLLPNNFRLKLKQKNKCFQLIKELTGQVMDTAEPNYIFEIVYNEERERKFKELQGARKTFHGYHGSRFDNFYSILHSGLNAHLNKVSVFGEGTYLSSELSVSLIYSPTGESWKNSGLGGKLSCVCVCQMIDDPSVKCQVKNESLTKQKQRAQASRDADAVPEKYYVVQNNDMMRVKYLLVYKHESRPQQGARLESSSYTWLRDHKFPLLMLAYVLLLVAIGLANSRHAMNAISRVFKSIS